MNKDQRRHQAMQIRQNKRDEMLAKKRHLGGWENAPFLVCILPLQKDVDGVQVLSLISKCDPEAIIDKSPTGVTHVT